MFSERGIEIITGPEKIAEDKLRHFSMEQGYRAEIKSPEPGKIVVYLNGDNGALLTDTEHYQTFLNQFLLLDDKFSPYTDESYTKWTIRIADSKFGPCIEAFYL